MLETAEFSAALGSGLRWGSRPSLVCDQNPTTHSMHDNYILLSKVQYGPSGRAV